MTPLPPPEVEAELRLDSRLDTPPLVASTNPSPEFDALVSPPLLAADKGFDLGEPAWRMPECWGHRGVGRHIRLG